MDPRQTISDLWRMLLRRLIIIIPVVVIGMIAAVLFALSRPAVYETSAKVLVEGPQISDELARSTVNMSAAARLQLIEQRLTARDSMAAMIDRLGLFADAKGLSMSTKIDLLRQATRIGSITSTGGAGGFGNPGGLFAFTITVALGDPEQAAAVANEFANAAIAQNQEVRADRARDTLAYFDAEDRRVAAAVAAQEQAISDFKRSNQDALPESVESRRTTLGRLQDSTMEIDRRVMELDEKLADLNAALAGERSLRSGETGVDPLEAELGRLELDLAGKRGVLAQNHPEIRRLTDQIAAVKLMVAPKSGGSQDDGATDARRTAIERQSAQISGQIAQLNQQKDTLAAQKTALEVSIRQTPQVEIELNALERRLADLQTLHTDVARRKAEARTGEQLEANQQSERFQVIESALVPEYPVSPNRKKLAVMGVAVSMGLAFGLAFLVEMLNPALRSTAQMERQLGIRPVVSIPYVEAAGERWRRRRTRLVTGALVLLAIWIAVPLIDRNVMPLAPLAARIGGAVGLGAGAAPAADPANL